MMYNKTGVRRFAIAVIIQALKDLTLKENGKHNKNWKYKQSAHNFFKNKINEIFVEVAGINNINYLYEKYKNKKLKLRKYYKKRKTYHRRKKVTNE